VRRASHKIWYGILSVAALAAGVPPAWAGPHAGARSATHPDFTGVWEHSRIPGEGEYIDGEDTRDLSFMMPWVETEVRRRERASLDGHPIPNAGVLCLPEGMPNILTSGHDLQIIQTPREVLILAESDHQILPVYINGSHPANLLPSWYGHSVGHWEGSALVIDTIGLSDKSLIDSTGTPHSEALHVQVTLRMRSDGKQIEAVFVLEDRLAFRRPWIYTRHYEKSGSGAVGEYACAENNDHYVSP